MRRLEGLAQCVLITVQRTTSSIALTTTRPMLSPTAIPPHLNLHTSYRINQAQCTF